MATDRTIIPTQGSGGDTNVPVATRDDASSLKHQKVLTEYLVGTTPTEVDGSHPLPVVQTGTPGLPTGAATETTLAAVNTKLGSALPLPTGASTETTVAAINTKLGSALPLPTGAATETTLAAVNTKLGSALPLPTGAATQTTLASILAKQPALGTAGAASTDVLTIQGIASGVAIPVSGSFSGTTDMTATKTVGALNDAAQITGMNGLSVAQVDIQASFSATLIFEGTVDGTTWVGIPKGTITTSAGGLIAASQVTTTAGNWTVPIAGLSGFRVRCSVYGSGSPVVTVRASAAAGVVALNQALPPGSNSIGTVVLGAGAQIVGAVRIDQTTPGTTNFVAANITQVAGSAISQGHGTAATAIRVELPTDSTGVIGVTDNAGSLTVDNAGTFAVQATEKPATSGGLTTHSLVSASGTNATSVKGSAGQVYVISCTNGNAAVRYFKLFNKATAPTVGSDTPVWRMMIPAGSGFSVNAADLGLALGTGIGYCLTTGIADADTGAVGTDILVNIGYA